MWNNKTVSLILPTYNEKDSIRKSINEFDSLQLLDEIIVVNNNAAAGTSEEVAQTNAKEVLEQRQGYGAAILRGLKEAKGDLIVICEPDDTFIPKDIYKLLSYSDECDVVYGSRTQKQFIWSGANMGWFLRFGNWAVAKMMEVLYNFSPLTDVGCTFRLLNRKALELTLDKCIIHTNYFGPEMMLVTKKFNLKLIQIPVNYKERIGTSSVTGDLGKAFKLGMKMIWLILTFRFRSDNVHK